MIKSLAFCQRGCKNTILFIIFKPNLKLYLDLVVLDKVYIFFD